MKFKKEDLESLAYKDEPENFKIIEDIICGHRRWSVDHSLVFKYKDKFYKTNYSHGATEAQDESPYEHDDNEIECQEVIPIEKTIMTYESLDGKE